MFMFANNFLAMNEPNIWTDEGDKVLKYLHEDLKIFNWTLISKQLS